MTTLDFYSGLFHSGETATDGRENGHGSVLTTPPSIYVKLIHKGGSGGKQAGLRRLPWILQ